MVSLYVEICRTFSGKQWGFHMFLYVYHGVNLYGTTARRDTMNSKWPAMVKNCYSAVCIYIYICMKNNQYL